MNGEPSIMTICCTYYKEACSQIRVHCKTTCFCKLPTTIKNTFILSSLINQDEQQVVFWTTGCPRICTVDGLLALIGWVAILQPEEKNIYRCCIKILMFYHCSCSSTTDHRFILLNSWSEMPLSIRNMKKVTWRWTHLFFISATIVMNACSTLVEFLALVSKNGIPSSSANAF